MRLAGARVYRWSVCSSKLLDNHLLIHFGHKLFQVVVQIDRLVVDIVVVQAHLVAVATRAPVALEWTLWSFESSDSCLQFTVTAGFSVAETEIPLAASDCCDARTIRFEIEPCFFASFFDFRFSYRVRSLELFFFTFHFIYYLEYPLKMEEKRET